MGFFDQLSKKAAETMQSAKDKTSKISAEMKFKSQLSEKKARIEALYSEIGKEIFSSFTQGMNLPEGIVEKCKEIISKNDEMKAINDEILKLKDYRICSSCGEKVSNSSEFCPKCGAKQNTVVESAPEAAEPAAPETTPTDENNQ